MSYRGKEKSSSLPFEDEELSPRPNSFSPKKAGGPSFGRTVALNTKLLSFLLLIWILTIHYFERIVPRQTMNACQWEKWEKWDEDPNVKKQQTVPHRIALMPDPQIIDDHTYPNKSRIFNYMTTLISDNYLRRNYKFMQNILDPDTTIFLGDLFDGGREWEDDEKWFKEYQRFMGIFPSKPNRRTIMSIPGNHDIGYQEIKPKVTKRFSAFFGEPNNYVEIGNHTIVMIDTISMSHPDPEISAELKLFLQNLDDQINPQLPRILLTHVPLYRFTDQQSCGPLREKGDPFPLQRGYQYQTVIDWEVSQTLLKTIDPDVIFSGDDHDYCQVKHKFNFQGIDRVAEEISAKTVSMTCGVKYPALQLLSLNNPYDPNPKLKMADDLSSSYVTEMCYLPLPYVALNTYIFLLVVTIGIVAMVYLFPTLLVRLADKLPVVISKKFKQDDLPQWKPLQFPKNSEFLRSLSLERNWLAFGLHLVAAITAVYSLFGFYYWYI